MAKVNWQHFLEHIERVTNILLQSKDLDLVVVLGNTGAGKSTTINLIKDVPLYLDDLGYLNAKSGQEVVCKIGEQQDESCTLDPQVILLKKPGFAITDTPGFLHTKEEEAAATGATIPLILQHSSVKGFIVVVDYSSFGDKGQKFKEIMQSLSSLALPEALHDRILFVVTKAGVPDKRIYNEIRLYVKDTIGENLINDNNVFIVHAEDKPNVEELKKALYNLESKSSLTKKDFAQPTVKSSNSTSAFRDLAVEIKVALKKYEAAPASKKATQAVYEALINTINGIHRVITHELHVPDIELIIGGALKSAFSEYFSNYSSNVCCSENLDVNTLREIVGYIEKIRKSMDEHFDECAEQLEYYRSLITSCESFLAKYTETKFGEIADFTEEERKSVQNPSSFVRLRHAQRDITSLISHWTMTGSDGGMIRNAGLLSRLEKALQDEKKFHAFVGWLLKYHKLNNTDSVNPGLMAKLAKEMASMERNGKLFGSSIDFEDRILNDALNTADTNIARIQALCTDKSFFENLVYEYYQAIEKVANAKQAYIDRYNRDRKQELDNLYANGQNVAPSNLNVLDRVDSFSAQFADKTINKLPGGFNSTTVADRYGETERALALPPATFFAYMRGRLETGLLASEYCNQISFNRAWQTAEVYHPEIAYERRGQAAIDALASLQPNIVYKGNTCNAFYNKHFIDGTLDFNIPMMVNASINGAAARDFFNVTFYGSYRDISVYAAGWYHGKEHISDSGGTGSYHHLMKNQLAPYIRGQWSSNVLRVELSAPTQPLPNLNAWFAAQRAIVGNALINFAEEAGQAPQVGAADRVQLLKTYSDWILQLNICTALLKLFSKLAGKTKFLPNDDYLLDQTKLAYEIRANIPDTTRPDLTPSLTNQKHSRGLNISDSNFNPEYFSFVSPLEALRVTKNLLIGHSGWRVAQKALPFIKALNPVRSLGLGKYIEALAADDRSVIIENHNFNMLQAVGLSAKLRGQSLLRNLSLVNCQLNTEQLFIVLGSLVDHEQLNYLDISCNPLRDDEAQSENFRNGLASLLEKHRLIELDLSYTKLSSKTVNVIAHALLEDHKMRSLNLLDISQCNKDAGLSLLAMLYVNTTLENLFVTANSFHPMLADAIDYILHHKNENYSQIPEELAARINYMDKVLNTFLDMHIPMVTGIPALSQHLNIFPRDQNGKFSLEATVMQLLKSRSTDARPTTVHMFRAKTARNKPETSQSMPSNKNKRRSFRI